VAHEIVVVSGHVAPDDPRSLTDWAALGRMTGTVVLMMAVERAGRFAAALITHGRPADTPVVVVQDGTTRIQRTVRTTLESLEADIKAADISPPAIIVVGPVAGLTAP
jgi:uroporphyrin-III C-methyltransferase/precorrin-2 dehydrogenase/sirohydrochlorin ferrochelatase